jgi:putative two-component system response regulator
VSHLLRSPVRGAVSIGPDPITLLSTPHILVVDDDRNTREFICQGLVRQAAYRCTAVGSAREALAVAREDVVDVALLDLSMPESDGMTLARRLRDDASDLPIVLVTGTRSFSTAVEAMRVGILDYLLKPFVMADLLDAVERAVQWRRAALQAMSERSELRRQIAERTDTLRETFSDYAVASLASLKALLETLNQRSPETFAHARRVARLSVPVAVDLGIEEPMLSAVERAALLHDLGKIAIPDSILLKPGRYTSDEFAIMKRHPVLGCEICGKLRTVRDSLPLIRHHHEKLDGSGYPDGLRGEALPQLVRIISIVDIYDALRSQRSYKEAFTVEKSFEIMWQEVEKGWWDRNVLTAWENLVRSSKKVANAD